MTKYIYKYLFEKYYHFNSCPIQLYAIKSSRELIIPDIRGKLWSAKYDAYSQEEEINLCGIYLLPISFL